MSDASTSRLIRSYADMAPVNLFLSQHFQTPPGNFFDTEEVEMDIERSNQEIAIVVQSLGDDGRANQSTAYTNKKFAPPIFKETATISAPELLKRFPGKASNENPDYQAHAFLAVSKVARKIQQKIQRTMELQASQVLQTGLVTLRDASNAALYTLDFGAKSTHKVTAGNAWNGGSANPLADLEALADVVHTDGKYHPDELIFGHVAWQDFMADATVQAYLNFRRAELAQLKPRRERSGAVFQGQISIAGEMFDVYTYKGTYDDPGNSGASTKYVAASNVIMTCSEAPLDLMYGGVPFIGDPEPNAMQFIPSRISQVGGGVDMFLNAWIAKDRQSITVQVSSRPICVPTAIDTIGCITTR